jgi:hypothetical protein
MCIQCKRDRPIVSRGRCDACRKTPVERQFPPEWDFPLRNRFPLSTFPVRVISTQADSTLSTQTSPVETPVELKPTPQQLRELFSRLNKAYNISRDDFAYRLRSPDTGLSGPMMLIPTRLHSLLDSDLDKLTGYRFRTTGAWWPQYLIPLSYAFRTSPVSAASNVVAKLSTSEYSS